MAIDFDAARWDKLKETSRQWWNHELERPMIPVVLEGRDPGRPRPDAPLLSQTTCADLSIPADRLIDRIDYELSTCYYEGDAFPYFNLDCFGPGVTAAFLGATLDNSTGRVWFHPPIELPIEEIHFRFDPDNVWFRRLCEIYTAGMRRWEGQVLMGMTDLGGNMDILSSFRPSEDLLLDLYDNPQEVKRLLWEAHEVWHQYYNALNTVLQPVNPGYTDWSRIYSDKPSFILQCDFSYMIGTGMFDEFALPEIVATCGRLERSFYHLDGKGAYPHLDSILAISDLNGMQWVPGDGQPNCGHWPEVYRKIQASGKLIQLHGGFEVLDRVIGQIGTGKGIHIWNYNDWTCGEAEDRDGIRRKLATYGI